MIKKITNYLASILQVAPENEKTDKRIAIASLLCAVAYADHDTSTVELLTIEASLIALLKVNKEEVNVLMALAKEEVKESTSIFDFTSQLAELEHKERIEVIEAMWKTAYADDHLGEIEEAIIRRVAGLIYVPHSEFIRTKLKVLSEMH
ncbi:TerB family tellurite resistance protein [Psychromonas hadalis]|uniref:tellurite resistance TerB family protein n=1 Tax=Psychromonas hadalis TaxID=211669 RepID=UPI0003B3FA06|nr:TerB family tellurite resistance protein [Psychromonas hadalis]